MNSEDERPTWNTTPLWGVLLVLLLIGTVSAATLVYGLLGLVAGNPWFIVPLGVGGAVSFLAFLFHLGILYRVDRYRGANLRRVEFFE